jgi:hypothetical protein
MLQESLDFTISPRKQATSLLLKRQQSRLRGILLIEGLSALTGIFFDTSNGFLNTVSAIETTH